MIRLPEQTTFPVSDKPYHLYNFRTDCAPNNHHCRADKATEQTDREDKATEQTDPNQK